MKTVQLTVLFVVLAAGTAGATEAVQGGPAAVQMAGPGVLRLAQRRSCQTVSTCRDAVAMWCGGYSRADGDGDGIPCENVCSSRAQVEAIKKEIGC